MNLLRIQNITTLKKKNKNKKIVNCCTTDFKPNLLVR